METYEEMRNRHQQEVNAFPMGAAFSENQFNEMMEKWGLDPEKDLDKICGAGVPGCFIRKSDKDAWKNLFENHFKEQDEAIAQDLDGTGFVYSMFKYELDNHEFGYTWDMTDALDCLGYTVDEVMSDAKLKAGLEKAIQYFAMQED